MSDAPGTLLRASALGHLPPGATPTGNTTIQLADNDNRVYSNERRTQIDVRFAKILRFGGTRFDVGVDDVNNLLNTPFFLAHRAQQPSQAVKASFLST
jgi:hypothetical protein